jgi:hypothetical protein
VPPRDPEALAGALRALLGDAGRRAELGRAGSRRARRRYGWSRIASTTRAVYDEVASLPVPAAARAGSRSRPLARGGATARFERRRRADR